MKYMSTAKKYGTQLAVFGTAALCNAAAFAGDYDGMTGSESSADVKAAMLAIGAVVIGLAWVTFGIKRVKGTVK
ncbi:Uncharacterised protein [Pseudomonas luteola]|uniref:Uncharacterized protein n=1 Tax=Pseudomonas luteola TaxID=47886 RepID=A0A2X2FDL2_PSELU|nr:hypothetical protein [Pseudomonas luteola]SPZ16890.1 Uncharacterised protein [Pseudomonas luteola]SPZ16909.1 Uncharacterised protein [Pseudomonas luteola]